MTDNERFKGVNNYAASTIGAPQYTNAADLTVFTKTKEEKLEVQHIKAAHKAELIKFYPDGVGRHLNIPKRELPEVLKWQF